MPISPLLLLAESLLSIGLILGAHAVRRKFSLGPFYSALAFVLVLTWALPQDLAVQVGSVRFLISSSILFSSVLLGAFASYTLDGPRAGRVAIGIIVGGTVFFHISAHILRYHGLLIDPSSAPLFPAFAIRPFMASLSATLADLFFLAVVWELLNRLRDRVPLLGRVFIALLLVLWLDVLIYITIAFVEHPAYLAILKGNFTTRLILAIFMAPLLTAYMTWEIMQFSVKFESRPLLAIFMEENLARELQAAQYEVAQGQQALQESEAKYRATVEDLPLMICGFQPNGVLTYTNSAFGRYFGFAAEDSGDTRFEQTVITADRERLERLLAGLSPSDPTGTLEVNVEHGSDETEDNRWSIRALFDQDLQLVAYLAIGEDVTRERNLEKQLNQSQKLEAVGRLAGGIAHDFNNILTAILGNCELSLIALKNNGHRDIAAASDGLREIEVATDRATALVRQLLIFGRKDVGRLSPQNFNTVVTDLQKMLSRIIPENVSIELNCAPELSLVEADRVQLEQVIMNLVINAGDAMPNGGTVRIRTSNLTVGPKESRYGTDVQAGEYISLEVVDSGTGISARDLGRIFEPFFTTKGPNEGTGLGLSTTFGIVKQAGGHLVVTSHPGLGSNFHVMWPVMPAIATGTSTSATTALPQSPPTPIDGTILVCEDEGTIRNLTVRQLQQSGYTVVAASNGKEALKVAAQPGMDIVMLVTDVVMPIMNGWDLSQELTKRIPELRVLFVTGYSVEVLAAQGIMSGEVNILNKPYRKSELLAQVQAIWIV